MLKTHTVPCMFCDKTFEELTEDSVERLLIHVSRRHPEQYHKILAEAAKCPNAPFGGRTPDFHRAFDHVYGSARTGGCDRCRMAI